MKRILLRILGYGFLALLLVIIGLAVFLWRSSHQARRDWDRYRAEAEARGTHFDIAFFVPAPVPDNENFAMTPLMREAFGPHEKEFAARLKLPGSFSSAAIAGRWQGQRGDLEKVESVLGSPDLLAFLKKYRPDLDGIEQAAQLPFSRFPLCYEQGFSMPVPHVSILTSLNQLYTLRALALLRTGRVDEAFEDVQTLARLAESVRDEPLLLSQLVRCAALNANSQVIWEGLVDHRWTEPQLATLQKELARVDLLKSLNTALEYERATAVEFFCGDLRSNPSGVAKSFNLCTDSSTRAVAWTLRLRMYQNILGYSQFFDRYFLPGIDPVAHRISAEPSLGADKAFQEIHERAIPALNIDHLLLMLALPSVSSTMERFTWTQTTLEQAIVACGLERYRLVHGEYPEALDVLVPQFVSQLPHDIVMGGPLHYRRTPDDTFVLYSVGWNGIDDGGLTVAAKSGKIDLKQGDWVWYGAPVAEATGAVPPPQPGRAGNPGK